MRVWQATRGSQRSSNRKQPCPQVRCHRLSGIEACEQHRGYLSGNNHSAKHGVLQRCGTSLAACLFRNKAPVQPDTHTHTLQPASLFLNQMCFYRVQCRFPRRFKYAARRSGSGPPALTGRICSSFPWLADGFCRPANWLEQSLAECGAGRLVNWAPANWL